MADRHLAAAERPDDGAQAQLVTWFDADPERPVGGTVYVRADDAAARPDGARAVPEVGYIPESGMVHRRLDDNLWYVVDVVSGEGDADPVGLVPLVPATGERPDDERLAAAERHARNLASVPAPIGTPFAVLLAEYDRRGAAEAALTGHWYRDRDEMLRLRAELESWTQAADEDPLASRERPVQFGEPVPQEVERLRDEADEARRGRDTAQAAYQGMTHVEGMLRTEHARLRAERDTALARVAAVRALCEDAMRLPTREDPRPADDSVSPRAVLAALGDPRWAPARSADPGEPDWHNMRERLHTGIRAVIGDRPRGERSGDADADLIEDVRCAVARSVTFPAPDSDPPAQPGRSIGLNPNWRVVACRVHGIRAVDLQGPDPMCGECRVLGPDGQPLGHRAGADGGMSSAGARLVGATVRAFYANDRGETRCTGRVVGYAAHPTVVIEREDGTRESWAAHLVEPAPDGEHPAAPRGVAVADDGTPIRNMSRADAVRWLEEVAASTCGHSQYSERAWAAARVLLLELASARVSPDGERPTSRVCDETCAAIDAANDRMGEALVRIGMALGLPKPGPGRTWGTQEILARIKQLRPVAEAPPTGADTDEEAQP